MKLKNIAYVSTFLAASALTLAAQPAAAGDSKIYPAADCQPEFGSRAPDLQSFGGFIRNVGSSSMTVTCPIVRDNTTNSNGIAQVSVRIQTLRSESTVGSRCTLESYNDQGQLLDIESKSIFGAAGFHTLVFQDVDFSQAHAGHYALKCSLSPTFTRIVEYRVNEF